MNPAFLVLLLACATPAADAPVAAAPPAQAAAPPLVRLELSIGAPDRGAPLIVAIHGLGDSPEGFRRAWTAFPGPARFVLPQGPLAWHDGWSWASHRAMGADPQGFARDVADAADRLAALLRELDRKPVITGFSQGGVLAFVVAVRHPDLVAGAVPVGGFLPEALWPTSGAGVPPVRAFHGDADAVIPVDSARASVARLRALGVDATLDESPGAGHTIDARIRAGMYAAAAELAAR